jgi:hypothetical protein
MAYFQYMGTIVHGSLKPEDIGPPCLDVARRILGSRKRSKRISEVMLDAHRANRRDWQGEHDTEILDDLMDVLTEIAPPFVHFGCSEGDGSDFGFWPDIDLMEEMAKAGSLKKVSGLEDLPKDFRGDVMIVNDHGNISYGIVNSRGYREIWACV